MDSYEAYKNKIGARVARALGEALLKGDITEEGASEIGIFVRDNIHKAKNSSELLDFLTDLSARWPIFDSILTIELGTITDRKEDVMVEQATTLIKENKIDEALSAVKSTA